MDESFNSKIWTQGFLDGVSAGRRETLIVASMMCLGFFALLFFVRRMNSKL